MSVEIIWSTVLIGGMFGSPQANACSLCAALVADDDGHRARHLAWHEALDAGHSSRYERPTKEASDADHA